MPRFAGDNFEHNLALVDALGAIAAEKRISVAQLAFAWVRARGDDIIPLIGARRRDQLAELIAALDVTLSADELARIEKAVPAGAAAGPRVAPAALAHLDSEQAH
jgi:aryl-alcohol dehydrogenase-like predicted oxidoreductase